MKVLLVGFADKNAAVFDAFCNRNMTNVVCHLIKREFDSHLRLTIPKLDRQSVRGDAYIIDLAGIGLTQSQPNYLQRLQAFIGEVPAIIITRRGVEEKPTPPFSSINRTICINAPYSKKIVTDALNKLQDLVASAPINDFIYNDFNKESFGIKTNASSNAAMTAFAHKRDASSKKALQQDESVIAYRSGPLTALNSQSQHEDSKIIVEVLNTYFSEVRETVFGQAATEIFIRKTPFELDFANVILWMNPQERSVILERNILKFIDRFALVGRFKRNVEISAFTEITVKKYDELSQQANIQGLMKYSLTTLLWQVAQEVIDEGQILGELDLAIQVKFMPNFSIMERVPKHTVSIVSACLAQPRTVNELHELFPDVTINEITRTFLFALLCGTVNLEKLRHDFDQKNTQPLNIDAKSSDVSYYGQSRSAIGSQADKQESINNKDINTAKKTGFFKRLLSKLAS